MSLTFNVQGLNNFLNWEKEIQQISSKVKAIHQKTLQDQELKDKYLGWWSLPYNFDVQELKKLKKLRKENCNLDVLVVVGIGGSYLGAQAGINFLQTPFQKSQTEVIFAGNNVSGNYLTNLVKYLKDKDWAINVISKSGTTLEPALTFRILQKEIQEKYGRDKSKKRIFVTTDKEKGVLLQIAIKEGYERFVIPQNIGGRYSVLSSVGLVPFVFADIDVEKILQGACQANKDLASDDVKENIAYQYAVARYLIYTKLDKKVEILTTYEPHLLSFSEWWKQLFAETEGKNNKGLFVSSVNNSTDLHSLGQFIQEGSKILFETILNVCSMKDDYFIPTIENELDNLNYLSGKSFSEINQIILKATKKAHIEGDVPNLEISIDKIDEYHLGYLIYFFERSCVMSCYLLGVFPFDQPGV
ncbi:glucose-6-phosphate isomerase, partial [Candidatus Phytoplasma phoenicium]